MLLALLAGFVFGFLGSMPLAGPISVLVFAGGLRGRHRGGLAVAAGAAVAESGYAFLAFWGTGELVSRFPVAMVVSQAAASLILLGLGLYFLTRPLSLDRGTPEASSLHPDFALGLGITALNPTFLATWTAATTVIHSTRLLPSSVAAAGVFAFGVSAGIYVWFWLLLTLMRRYASALRPAWVGWAMRAVGMVLLGMGAWSAVTVIAAM